MSEPNILDELRNRLSIAEVVGARVKLTRKGREFSGLCPFHSEKTPSFTVSAEKGFYHCFGCGAHGDAITFVMKTQNLPFREALEQLAAQAGLELPKKMQRRDPEAQALNDRLLRVIQAAQEFFTQQLQTGAGDAARQYLQKRGLSVETQRQFALGYAPDAREVLKSKLQQAGHSIADAVTTGMLIEAEQRAPYDRFRGRIMFPIFNGKQQPIAFGGRILGAGEPKYLNSPETPLFHKGQTVYALSHATATIGKGKRQAIVVEGYMDAIALHQAGFANAVANLGTALTEQQVQLLWRYGDQVVLCFDGDNAGQRAALRAIERMLPILQPGKEIRFITMPTGFDPDSLILAKGPGAFQALLDQATPFYAALAQMEIGEHRYDTPEARVNLSRRLQQRLAVIADPLLREQYRQAIFPLVKDIIRPPQAATVTAQPTGQYQKKSGRGQKPVPYTYRAPDATIGKLRQGDMQRREREVIVLACVLHPDLLQQQAEALGSITLGSADLELLRLELLSLAAEAVPDRPLWDSLSPSALEIARRLDAAAGNSHYWLRPGGEVAHRRWLSMVDTLRHNLEHAEAALTQAMPPMDDAEAFQRWAEQRQAENLAQYDFAQTLLEDSGEIQ
jgi:DNA primase